MTLSKRRRTKSLSILLVILSMAAGACRREPVTATLPSGAMMMIDVDDSHHLRWQGSFDRPGAVFAVIDADGYRALVRARRASDVDCDHCGGPLVDLDTVSGELELARGKSAIAVGPIAAPVPPTLTKARIQWLTFPATDKLDEAWKPIRYLDIDGDGLWDYEQVVRCGEFVRSGCSERVCNEMCIGVRRRSEGAPDHVACKRFIPDVEDCAR